MAWKSRLANTRNKREDRPHFRIRLNVIKIRRTANFAETIIHELEHVGRFRCGETSRHHPGYKKKREYQKRARDSAKYVRIRSKTLRLFEEWLEHTKNENGAVKVVAKAAANALAGNAPPPRR